MSAATTSKRLQPVNNNTPLGSELWNNRYLYMFVVPGVIWFLVFAYQPMYGVLIAFKDYDILHGVFASDWVGLKHFNDFFNSSDFSIIMTNTIAISLLKLLLGFPAPIVLALLLNEARNLVFKRIAQTVSYLPFFVSWVVVVGIWYELFSIDGGVVNNILMFLNIVEEPVFFFGDPNYFWGMVVASDIWKGIGFGTIIYLAAIASVSPELYESAVIDGASRMRQIWHITLPTIRPTIILLLVLNMGHLLDAGFEQILIMQNPMVLDKSEIIDTYVMKIGIFRGNYEVAAAVGLFKSVIGMIMLFSVNFLVKRFGEDGIF